MPFLARVFHDDTIEEAKVEGSVVTTQSGHRIAVGDARFSTPTAPSKIICVGFNYRDHAQELGRELPSEPLFFLKPPSALLAHGETIVYPPETKQLEFECELAAVIGARCRNVPIEDARSVILGYSIFNDVTARDIQKVEPQWVRAKCFDTFAPYGPVVATHVDPLDLRLVTRVNGIVKQDSSTRHLAFDVPALVAMASRIMTLEPGDIIATGTPAGVGQLQPGDEVSIEIEGIGTLTNSVAAEE
ncbi:MAG: fumarylacetoacetate hydrolase family protein [Armatimonadetes bacterium]|nr:fumarylacetoacetate hydrolase family protein [Armatimonadota bacterium]